jgi:hypothetical protein
MHVDKYASYRETRIQLKCDPSYARRLVVLIESFCRGQGVMNHVDSKSALLCYKLKGKKKGRNPKSKLATKLQ